MGFIQQMLQNAQQGTMTSPQQSAQARLGQSGLLDSLRSMQGPTTNLPTPSQAQTGGSAPFGGQGLGSGILGIIQQLRQQNGQQGLGSSLPRPNLTPVQNPGQWSPPTSYPRPPQVQAPTSGANPLQGLQVGGTRTNPTYTTAQQQTQSAAPSKLQTLQSRYGNLAGRG